MVNGGSGGVLLSSASDDDSHDHVYHHHQTLDPHILRGLTIAGVVTYCFNTLFGLFHVDVFLRAYQLPYTTYSVGRFVYGVTSTIASLWGAWWIDSQVAMAGTTSTTTKNSNGHNKDNHHNHSKIIEHRSDVVGCLGVLLSLSFVMPFCRFWQHESGVGLWQVLDGLHFVVSMTIYDTLSTIMTISLASAVSDDHNMTDQERVQNMSSSQVYNLVASMMVAFVGLLLFPHNTTYGDDMVEYRLGNFQFYIVVLAGVAIWVYGMAQSIISGKHLEFTARNPKHKLWHIWKGWTVALPSRQLQQDQRQTKTTTSHTATNHDIINNNHNHSSNHRQSSEQSKNLEWRQAMMDLWSHTNFIRWIVLEMLLEMQTHFVQTFFKTFLDQLLVDLPHEITDWALSLLRPMQQIMTIFCYVPIRRYGYAKVYLLGLGFFFILSFIMLLIATPKSSLLIFLFLVIYVVGTEAIRAAGFYLVMSDLVLELKLSHSQQGRFNEPSLAGLLLGATTLFCKPMQSVLPIIAATLLDKYPQNTQSALYDLLVIPPFICCFLQLWVWWDYDLHPKRTHELRIELQEFHFYSKKQAPSSNISIVTPQMHYQFQRVQEQQHDKIPQANGTRHETPKRRGRTRRHNSGKRTNDSTISNMESISGRLSPIL